MAATQDLKKITTTLKSQSLPLSDPQTSQLLRTAKRSLLALNALTPFTITDPTLLTLALFVGLAGEGEEGGDRKSVV